MFSIGVGKDIGSYSSDNIDPYHSQSYLDGVIAEKLCNSHKSRKDSEPCDVDTICLSLRGFYLRLFAIILTTHDNDIQGDQQRNHANIPRSHSIKKPHKYTQTRDIQKDCHCCYVFKIKNRLLI